MDRYDPYTDKFIKAQPHTYRGVTLNDVMMYFDSLEGNEDAWTEFQSCFECRGWGLYHIRSATDKNVGTTDARQNFMDIVYSELESDPDNNRANRIIKAADEYMSAQPKPHYDEWCTDCKEYDHENRCCPRWTKVIRQTRRELQDEFVMTAVDGTLWVTVDDVQKVGRVIVDEDKSKFCKTFYGDGQVEQKWIPVSDKLPDEKGEYLVTYHPCYWDNVYDEIKVGFDTFRGKTKWAKKKHQRVIAWKPIDEPYKPIM